MTVKEVIKLFNGQYDYVELFVGEHFHTDSCDSYNPENGYGSCRKGEEYRLNSYCNDYNAEQYELMDAERYDASILANCSVSFKDFGWDKDTKILCVLISRKSIAMGEEYGRI